MPRVRRGFGDSTLGPMGAWWCPLFGPAAPAMFTQCPGVFTGTPLNPTAPGPTPVTSACDPSTNPACCPTFESYNASAGTCAFDPTLWSSLLLMGGLGLGLIFAMSGGRRR